MSQSPTDQPDAELEQCRADLDRWADNASLIVKGQAPDLRTCPAGLLRVWELLEQCRAELTRARSEWSCVLEEHESELTTLRAEQDRPFSAPCTDVEAIVARLRARSRKGVVRVWEVMEELRAERDRKGVT